MKRAGDEAGRREPLVAVGQQAQEEEEHDAFQPCLVELARMARDVPPSGACGKHHRPGHVGRPAPQFAVHEIGEAAEEEAEGHRRRDHVEQRQDRDASRAREQHHGEDRAEEAAVERHAAVPDRDDLDRVGEEDRQIVEQHVADAAADDDADRGPDDEVVDVGRASSATPAGPHRRSLATSRLAYHQPTKMPAI